MRTRHFVLIIALAASAGISTADAQSYSVLYDFGPISSSDGNTPLGSLIQSGSDLYGFALLNSGGSIFQFDPATNVETTLSHFTSVFSAVGTPVQSGSILYGMTNGGGIADEGSIFQYSFTSGSVSILHSFGRAPTEGTTPWGSLIQSGNILYGMTSNGGDISSGGSARTGPIYNNGTIFQYNLTTGTESVLHSFGASGDGVTPMAHSFKSALNFMA